MIARHLWMAMCDKNVVIIARHLWMAISDKNVMS